MIVLAPVAGTAIGMAAVPDPVFSQALVGPGMAVDPVREPGLAVAPISGRLVKLHPHAYIVVGDDERGVLVHLGIDTVQLKGEGFALLAAEGDLIGAGQPVVSWDPATIGAGGRSPVCAVVALEAVPDSVTPLAHGRVRAGQELFEWA